VERAEGLASAFPWNTDGDDDVDVAIVDAARDEEQETSAMPAAAGSSGSSGSAQQQEAIDYSADLVAVPSAAAQSDPSSSFLFVLPRQYRGVGLGLQELSSFLQFCSAVQRQLSLVDMEQQQQGQGQKRMLTFVPLHPLMNNPEDGRPDHLRRAPYPSLLFSYLPAEPSV